MTEQPAIADPVQHVTDAVAASDNATVYVPDVELNEGHQHTLALAHDIRTVWDVVRGVWAASRGVPEEELQAHEAATAPPEEPAAEEPAVEAPAAATEPPAPTAA